VTAQDRGRGASWCAVVRRGRVRRKTLLQPSPLAFAAAVGAGIVLLSGCGTAQAPASNRVQVSLTAPTDGAKVTVPTIEVLGTITPRNAVLHVSGKRVRIRHGAFKSQISLHHGLTRIRIKARARGFASSSMVVSVRYAPRGATAASPGGQTGASYAQHASQPTTGGGHSNGRFASGVSSFKHSLGSAIAGRSHRCGGSDCGLIP
jgi:hypothetical protein